MSDWNQKIIEEFRANEGRVGGPFEGSDLLLLTTVGARTGRRHTTPLVYVTDGDRVLITASNAGAPKHPAWFHNVLATPEVEVEAGTRKYTAQVAVVDQADRDRLYAMFVKVSPGFAEYEAKTTRVIPVLELTS
ncbi:nitroreductase family deazaflavin-dependent oxidoreductase [Actinophytocola sediminis]